MSTHDGALRYLIPQQLRLAETFLSGTTSGRTEYPTPTWEIWGIWEAARISIPGGSAADNEVVGRTSYISLNPVVSKETGR